MKAFFLLLIVFVVSKVISTYTTEMRPKSHNKCSSSGDIIYWLSAKARQPASMECV